MTAADYLDSRNKKRNDKDADKEDVEETKKAQKKFRQIATAYFKFIEKELSCLTHERNQPRILSNYPPP